MQYAHRPRPVAPAKAGTGEISLRPIPAGFCARALAIGSSTGGPQALFKLFEDLRGSLSKVPVFVTQHMPATFTTILAEHLGRSSGMDCAEAEDGEPVRAGRIYVARGDYHLVVKPGPSGPVIKINQDPPENFCRPAVDPMLRSLAAVYERRLLTVILTGMGQDGMRGSRVVVEKGGVVIGQDEATSVVWGMPGAVATNGLCSAVLPLDRIAAQVRKLTEGASA